MEVLIPALSTDQAGQASAPKTGILLFSDIND